MLLLLANELSKPGFLIIFTLSLSFKVVYDDHREALKRSENFF